MCSIKYIERYAITRVQSWLKIKSEIYVSKALVQPLGRRLDFWFGWVGSAVSVTRNSTILRLIHSPTNPGESPRDVRTLPLMFCLSRR